MKIITCGRRRASARPSSMASTSWFTKPPTSSSRIPFPRAISETALARSLSSTLSGVDGQSTPVTTAPCESVRGAGLPDDGDWFDVRRLFDWRSRRDLRDAGFRWPDPVFRLRIDGARPCHHLRPDGRHQHGARRVHDPRRLRHLDDIELIPVLPSRSVRRLLFPVNDPGLYRFP